MKSVSTRPKIPKVSKAVMPKKPNFGTPKIPRMSGLKNPLRFTK